MDSDGDSVVSVSLSLSEATADSLSVADGLLSNGLLSDGLLSLGLLSDGLLADGLLPDALDSRSESDVDGLLPDGLPDGLPLAEPDALGLGVAAAPPPMFLMARGTFRRALS